MEMEMPYIAACLNHEVQHRLATSLEGWAAGLNERLSDENLSLLTVERATSKPFEGTIQVDEYLLKVFQGYVDKNGCLLGSTMVSGIKIGIPEPAGMTSDLSLLFLQATGTPFDGLAVNPWKTRVGAETDWILLRPAFYPRFFGEWFAKLLAVLNVFDDRFDIRETSNGLLPASQYAVGGITDFNTAMSELADSYLEIARLAGEEETPG